MLSNENNTEKLRKIIHVDMDAFYASVEQRDFPDYKNQPLAVGGSAERGVVMAASYEARSYGVRSAMPSITAKRLCPRLIFAKPRMGVYKSVSQQIRDIFYQFTELVEPLSLDEAYLDVTTNLKQMPYATEIAQEIKQSILSETQLTASAGVSYNKFLAKVASDINKPNGITVIKPAQAQSFIDQLPIEKFYGIGKVTAQKLKQMGVYNGAGLKEISKVDLIKRFGKQGNYFYHISRGVDHRIVKANRQYKSVSSETTFDQDTKDLLKMKAILNELSEDTWKRIEKIQAKARTVTLKVKYHDFTQKTRSKTLDHFVQSSLELAETAFILLTQTQLPDEAVRLLGIGVSNLNINEPEVSSDQLAFDF